MAKNITIREGDTSKQFTAKKLKVNLVGGGTANFIPEDEAIDYADVKDHEFKENGTFNPSDFNCDAFGQVKVAVPANVKEKTITKNGVFNAASDNCLGYSKVTVNVPGGGGGGPYTVNFFGDDYETVLKTETNVPYGGSASCTELDGTILNGLYFKGWNPVPSNVRDNMNCYPVRGDYIFDPNEIQDNWETIVADGGAHYPLGSYKSLVCDFKHPAYHEPLCDPHPVYSTYWRATNQNPENTVVMRIAMDMVKVAEGEDGTHSTWISTGVVHFENMQWEGVNESSGQTYGQYGSMITYTDSENYAPRDWSNCALRYCLNNYFVDQLPLPLAQNIKPVTKTTKGKTSFYHWIDAPIADIQTQDRLWIPSWREFHALLENYDHTSVDGAEEFTGVDYSLVYAPTYLDNYNIRTIPYNSLNLQPCPIAVRVDRSTMDAGLGYANFPLGFCL